jgi:predicted DNA-binding protein YlxM (UPF0122 family)
MTNKQTTTLILFAQNYSLQIIAKKQQVSLATIRERIKSLSKNYPIEFGNALALRKTYKRNRELIRSTKTLDISDENIIKQGF